ncbi:hypothetical protein QIW49_08140 [Francisellaceae bacterium CB300]
MSKKILVVLEGIKPEKKITNIINTHLLPQIELKDIVVYGNNIYKLYSDITKDPFSDSLSTFELLEEYSDMAQNSDFFDTYSKEDFAYIYLFFDYDPWDSSFDYSKVDEMLAMFDNPTEQGKLYINYPSSESFVHITENFYISTYNKNSDGKYKTLVGDESPNNLNYQKFTKNLTLDVCNKHLSKANNICNGVIEMPQSVCQKDLYNNQKDMYSDKEDIYILSNFPSFVLDFLGYKEFLSLYEK